MKKRLLLGAIAVTLVGLVFAATHPSLLVRAAATFTVNSTGDDPDDNPGDGTCETSTPGECTFRAAIQEANATAGTDTINFNIAGGGVHTLTPASQYDYITEAVTINGYSQTGSSANTVAAPGVPTGTLTIEIDGTSAGGGSIGLAIDTTGVTVRGLVVNNFDGTGILITDTGGGNTIAGNYIGTDDTGASDAGNAGSGVEVWSSNNTIGGTAAADRNLISGNGDSGVEFNNVLADSNTVAGNVIGLNRAGTAAIANTFDGVVTIAGANNNTVGGTTSGSANVLSGNGSDGVESRSSGTVVQGNLIGTNPTGTVARGNGALGVHASSGATLTTIGGTSAAARNIISGNSNGILLSGSTNATVTGNYIGTDINGTAALSNTTSGISIEGSNSNTVGGTTSGARNIISGNSTDGIDITTTSSSNTIVGNYIGTDVNGTTALGNGQKGVLVGGDAASNTIGGTADGSRNVISGNADSGIAFDSTADTNSILGNYIGVDATGLADLGNGESGISVASSSTGGQIGGTSAAARNIISGNAWSSIVLAGTNAIVQGNYMGLDKNGTAVIANAGGTTNANVQITGDNNTFGGTDAGAGNAVSGTTTLPGISIIGLTPFGGSDASGNKVQGNYIGTDASGNVQTGFGNSYGVQLALDAVNNLVGGTTSGAGNTIAGNNAGVVVVTYTGGTPAINNSILGNSIHDNTGGSVTSLGIDLMQTANFSTFVNAGVTDNDADDIDFGGTNTGTNHYLNFPVISNVTSTNGTATITYDLDINDSEAGATGYRVEFFANTSPDPSGNGEGETYLGSDFVSGDVTGRQTTITLPSGVSGAKYIVATTTTTDNSTDGFGHSSEFSANTAATLVAATANGGGAGAASDLANTGQNTVLLWAAAAVLLGAGSMMGARIIRRNQSTISGR